MTEDRVETVRINKEDFFKMSKEDRAEICTMVMRTLAKKANELAGLYKQLMTTYQEEMLVTGISVVCAISAEAFPLDDPLVCMTYGTPEGIMHAASPLLEVLKKASMHLKEEDNDTDETDEADEAAG